MSCEYENPLNKKISKTSFAAIITMKLFKLVLYKKKKILAPSHINICTYIVLLEFNNNKI